MIRRKLVYELAVCSDSHVQVMELEGWQPCWTWGPGVVVMLRPISTKRRWRLKSKV